MEHNEYTVTVEFDDEAGFFHGDVFGSRGGFTFQGDTLAELKEAFNDSLVDYLMFCTERGKEPDNAFTGETLCRVTDDAYRAMAEAAELADKAVNDAPSQTGREQTTSQTA